MICTQCGSSNAAGNKFCEACGKSLTAPAPLPVPQPSDVIARQATPPSPAPVPQPPASPGPLKAAWRSWIRRVAAGGSLLVLVGFVLPWVLGSSFATPRPAGFALSMREGINSP